VQRNQKSNLGKISELAFPGFQFLTRGDKMTKIHDMIHRQPAVSCHSSISRTSMDFLWTSCGLPDGFPLDFQDFHDFHDFHDFLPTVVHQCTNRHLNNNIIKKLALAARRERTCKICMTIVIKIDTDAAFI